MIVSHYRLEEEIGAGGEARVFRARDLSTDRIVAVRLARDVGTGPATIVPEPSHPGWVTLYDHGVDPRHGGFHVFEFLAGEALGLLVGQGPLPPKDWRDFVVQSLDAVEALHAAGWTHGDLNADNFIRTRAGRWKLLELPFHRFSQPNPTTPPLFGSIYTLAPERLAGRPANPLTDLYALGCLYYYAASGGYPHAVGRASEIAVDRLRFPAAPLEEKAPGLKVEETRFVMALLHRDPQDRPSDPAAARRLLGISSPPAPGA